MPSGFLRQNFRSSHRFSTNDAVAKTREATEKEVSGHSKRRHRGSRVGAVQAEGDSGRGCCERFACPPAGGPTSEDKVRRPCAHWLEAAFALRCAAASPAEGRGTQGGEAQAAASGGSFIECVAEKKEKCTTAGQFCGRPCLLACRHCRRSGLGCDATALFSNAAPWARCRASTVGAGLASAIVLHRNGACAATLSRDRDCIVVNAHFNPVCQLDDDLPRQKPQGQKFACSTLLQYKGRKESVPHADKLFLCAR
ncbi:hypothetical protein HPB50_027388 [Hyalomma asiaticum]|uniref:Uncharacterized protein n=1 Tax=Hyalomma asiaticum TaxID=266040 RepID=A0ACB7TQ03_HYAAI|nr:hypothetical protein HPB50_027388 [Hyalomma asiaticum]